MSDTSNETPKGDVAVYKPKRDVELPSYLADAFDVDQQVTRSVLRQLDNEPFYCQFTGPIKRSSVPPKEGMEPPEVCDILNLETGELQTLIINTVLGSELRRNYPEDGYVGRYFGIMRGRSVNDKRYKGYKIVELKRKSYSDVEKVNEIDAMTVDKSKHGKINKR